MADNFVQVKLGSGNTIVLNLDHIVSFQASPQQPNMTRVDLTVGDSILIAESRDDFFLKISKSG